VYVGAIPVIREVMISKRNWL